MTKQVDPMCAHESVTVAVPSKLTDSEIEELKNLVLKGGQVRGAGLRQRIKNAKLLAFIRVERKMIAVGAIKYPEASYVRRIARKSGYAGVTGYKVELGYISVKPGLRGKGRGTRITHALVEKLDRPTFATTTKPRMEHILCGEGFEKVGRPWPSEENPKSSLTLWVRRG